MPNPTNDAGLPGVSVVIPVWGRYVRDYLPRALASLQAPEIHEIVVVDNCSIESITDIADNRVRVIRSNSQLSLGAARNLGLHSVHTEFVLFLDADDELVPASIAAMLHIIRAQPDVVAVAPRIIDGNSGAFYHWPRRSAFLLSRHFPNLYRVAEAVRPMFPVNAALISTAVARDSPGYGLSPEAAEDWLLGVSLTLRGPVLLIDEPGIVYHSRSDGMWRSGHSRWRRQARHRREVRKRLREDPASPPLARVAQPALWAIHEADVLRKLFR